LYGIRCGNQLDYFLIFKKRGLKIAALTCVKNFWSRVGVHL